MWTKFAYQTGAWMALEIWLNLMGLDNIADYSEFIFAFERNLNLKNHTTVKIIDFIYISSRQKSTPPINSHEGAV